MGRCACSLLRGCWALHALLQYASGCVRCCYTNKLVQYMGVHHGFMHHLRGCWADGVLAVVALGCCCGGKHVTATLTACLRNKHNSVCYEWHFRQALYQSSTIHGHQWLPTIGCLDCMPVQLVMWSGPCIATIIRLPPPLMPHLHLHDSFELCNIQMALTAGVELVLLPTDSVPEQIHWSFLTDN